MKTLEIIGYNRANLGKSESKRLRLSANVPCVLYGGADQVHFYSPMILFRDLVYTTDANFVELNIEGDLYKCVLQDIQFHPVSEVILHADFLLLQDDKPVKMDIPVNLVGKAPGLQAGGKLMLKLKKLTVKAMAADMPDAIDVDISALELGKSVKVSSISVENVAVQNSPNGTIASIVVPRALRGLDDEDGEATEDGEEAAAE